MKNILFAVFLLSTFVSCGVAEEDRYVNQEIGFSISGPKGWTQKAGGGGQLARFTPTPFEDFPIFSVILEEIPAQEKEVSVLDVSNAILADFQRSYKTKVVEPPTTVNVGDAEGARFVLDVENVKRTTNQAGWLRNLFYQFMKKDKVVSVMATAESDQFPALQERFENAVKSFRWTEN